MLKRFLRAHPGFNRDDIQYYLNFILSMLKDLSRQLVTNDPNN